MDSKKRQEIRAELVSQGYAWDYVDSWPPKVTLWVHRDLLNTEGQVSILRGTALPNHPGHPDHLARKSRIGLLNWPPGPSCRCKACREALEAEAAAVKTQAEAVTVSSSQSEVSVVVQAEGHRKVTPGKCACGWESQATRSAGRATALYSHLRRYAAVGAAA